MSELEPGPESSSSKRALPSSPDSGTKKQKTDPAPSITTTAEPRTRLRPVNETIPAPVSKMGLEPTIPIMPPSLELITGVKADLRASKGHIGQEEVGIIGYVGEGMEAVSGVIKQRFTDFLVNEVGMDGEVVHLKDISKPKEPTANGAESKAAKSSADESALATKDELAAKPETAKVPAEDKTEAKEGPEPQSEPLPSSLQFAARPGWTETTTRLLVPHFSESTIISLHDLFVEGKEPPRKSDNGWGSRPPRPAESETLDPIVAAEEEAMNLNDPSPSSAIPETDVGSGKRGQGRDRGRGRGGRGGSAGGRGGSQKPKDEREVLSQLVTNKEERTACHKIIREAFRGVYESAAKQVEGEEGSRIVITYSRAGSRQNGWGNKDKPNTKHLPPYIHFTLQKTNRETQDALTHLSRQIGCQIKDLGIAGTKDKRAVTVQRVSLKRNNKTTEGVWKAVNGLTGGGGGGGRGGRGGARGGGRGGGGGWVSERKVMSERGDRGTRIGDLTYEKEGLDLGLLKGNQFKITLRNVIGEDDDAINATMASLRDHGFINFYGMQRFGTSSVPTHLTGLHILRSEWSAAITSILSLRQNEHPDCIRGRLAWLEDGDLGKALDAMPRRCVAERSIWEFWKRTGSKSDYLGALGGIPRTLRTMYVHAYQSYIWNLITSERIKLSSTKPLLGDLVIVRSHSASANDEVELEETAQNSKSSRSRPALENSSSQTVKHLTEEDLDQYTIFDVVVPLPGFDVEYPKGRIGELYEEMMQADGLDVNRMRRDQREYSLPGSYRQIINRPSQLTWSILRYTDPNLPLVQSDEDSLLNLNPALPSDPQGKFKAVILELTLQPSSYATMALREVTREETASWWQTSLTVKGEDQGYRDGAKGGEEGEEGVEGVEGEDEGEVAEEVQVEEETREA